MSKQDWAEKKAEELLPCWYPGPCAELGPKEGPRVLHLTGCPARNRRGMAVALREAKVEGMRGLRRRLRHCPGIDELHSIRVEVFIDSEIERMGEPALNRKEEEEVERLIEAANSKLNGES